MGHLHPWEPAIASSPKTLIRAGGVEDLPILVELQRRASIAGYPDPARRLLTSQPELIAESFRYEWFSTDRVRVATKGQCIVGFAVLERSEAPEAEIAA